MNQFIKLVIFIWLMFCALFIWVGIAFVGFLFTFTNWSFIYEMTPWIGLTAAICIIKCAIYVLLKSNPIAYIEGKIKRLGEFLGKEKV